jgi:hypothetical protein
MPVAVAEASIPCVEQSDKGENPDRPTIHPYPCDKGGFFIAIIAHACIPVFGVGIPGFAGELVGVVYPPTFLP